MKLRADVQFKVEIQSKNGARFSTCLRKCGCLSKFSVTIIIKQEKHCLNLK